MPGEGAGQGCGARVRGRVRGEGALQGCVILGTRLTASYAWWGTSPSERVTLSEPSALGTQIISLSFECVPAFAAVCPPAASTWLG